MTRQAVQLEQDAAMTAQRGEAKYLISVEQGRVLMSEIDRRLAPHRHVGKGANRLPDPRHYVTTIYFDTPSRALFRAAQSSESHLKLRAKEYYDLHPGLTETATDPRQLVRFQPTLWLELKARDRGTSGKQRIGLPKNAVPSFFALGEISAEMIALQEPAYGADAKPVLEAVTSLCASLGEPLAADCLVNYRRFAWQDEAGTLRITLDQELAFFRPPADLWTRDWALVRATLGTAVMKEKRMVLEVKTRAEPPTWLVEALRVHGTEHASFSKFEAATTAIHG